MRGKKDLGGKKGGGRLLSSKKGWKSIVEGQRER